MLTLSDADFQRLYTYIKTNYGIDLSKKKSLIVSRLSNTLKAGGYTSFSQYIDDVISGRDKDMVTSMLNKLTTNYTYFPREEEHFKYLWDVILPDLAKKHAKDKVLAIWSAGCSSGEEPYTISMYLKEYFGPQASQWDTRVLATDISQKILNTAINATYGEEGMSSLPPTWKQKYFVRKDGNTYTVAPAIKQNVIFRTFNLMDPIQFKKKFDLIFCRNVMIYFDQPTKSALARRMFDATVPGGYLIISKAENLPPDTPYARVATSIFQKR